MGWNMHRFARSLAAVTLAGLLPGLPAEAQAPGSARFDHSGLDRLLKARVDADGLVDYGRLRGDSRELDAYLASLATVALAGLPPEEQLALQINAYNAFTLRLILDHHPVASIKDIPSGERWRARRFRLAGETLSLDDLEHQRIRRQFDEPRIHFALVCAARGCPPLRREAYEGSRLAEQLADQSRRVHQDERFVRFEAAAGVLHLTHLYDWYGDDFRKQAPSVAEYVGRELPAVRAALDAGVQVRVRWLPYDWSLNAQP
jgi:hypothetical protein